MTDPLVWPSPGLYVRHVSGPVLRWGHPRLYWRAQITGDDMAKIAVSGEFNNVGGGTYVIELTLKRGPDVVMTQQMPVDVPQAQVTETLVVSAS